MLKVLFIGDVVGSSGRKALEKLLPHLKREYSPDLTVLNVENAAAGFGITKKVYEELCDYNIDVMTGGNHIWDKKEIFQDIDSMDRLIRPLNYPSCPYGQGSITLKVKDKKVCIVNLLGRVFVHWTVNCPFQTMDRFLEENKADIVIVDMHAETTSEKKALGFYLDGKVSAVIGTHTHVQTSDARILPKGTGYLTDAGMVGSMESVLGMKTETAINRFLYGIKEKFEVEETAPIEFNGCLLEIDDNTGKTLKIQTIRREV